jgi:hypothetical protein
MLGHEFEAGCVQVAGLAFSFAMGILLLKIAVAKFFAKDYISETGRVILPESVRLVGNHLP